MDYQTLLTQDGSLTLVHPEFNEAYSSVHGAWNQACQLYVQAAEVFSRERPCIFEMGFGLGVNFRATLAQSLALGAPFDYVAVEGFPAPLEVLATIGVPAPNTEAVWQQVLQAWGGNVTLEGDWGSLNVLMQDIAVAQWPQGVQPASAVYFDPFSPDVNPDPWQAQVLSKVADWCSPAAVLTTYSVAGVVKRNLRQAGFEVGKIKGYGKREWLRAVKP